MNTFKTEIVALISIFLAGLSLATLYQNKMEHRYDVARYTTPEPMQPMPPQAKPEPLPKLPPKYIEPPAPERKLPCKGVAMPNARVYRQSGSAIIDSGEHLVDKHLFCDVYQKLTSGTKNYYLIYLTHEGYVPKFYILEESKLIFLSENEEYE